METRRQIDRSLLSLILSERLPDSDWDSFSAPDWDSIVRLAQAEGVGPLLYWRLSRSERIGRLPEPLQAALRAMYFGTKLNNEQIVRELKTLAGPFEQAGIPVVVLKGVCFALTIYPDIDVLVPARRFSEAVRIVKGLGYVEDVPEAVPGLRALLGDEISLRKTGTPYTVLELHNSLLVNKSFSYAVPVDWFWEQTDPLSGPAANMKFETLRMLTPSAQLLYASAHAVLTHGGPNMSLRWLYDLDCLIRSYAAQIDWDLVLSRASMFHWSSALDVALSQTCRFFNSPVPDSVLAQLSNTRDRHRSLIEQKGVGHPSRVMEEYQNLRTRKWYGRLVMLLGLIAPAPAYMRWRYGLKSNWSLPAWYLYRWWGICKDAVKTLWLVAHRRVS